MRVAIVTPSYSSYSETFIKAQIELLPADLVLHGGWLPTHYNKKLRIQNIFVFYLYTFFRLVFKCKILQPQNAIARILKKNKIEIVLAQYGPTGVEMLPVCKKLNIPLFVHFHGFDASDFSTLKKYEQGYKELFRAAKGIIAVSTVMKEKLIQLGCVPEKISTIIYGPNNIFFENKPTYQCSNIFGVGRFVNKKAPYLTILAFKELHVEFPEVKLRIAGDGELLNTCRNIVSAYQLENNVYFLGVISPEQTQNEMEKAFAFVQHSVVADSGDSEGTPVAILEAQAAALPVISTYHAGIPDLVSNGITGYLVKEKDIFGMKEAMKKLYLDRKLAEEMGKAGRTRIKNNFTMEMYIDKLRKKINAK